MTVEEIKKIQKEEREKCLQKILESNAPRKLVVAGPGTGKTYMFSQVLQKNGRGKNLAMTFIRRLAEDMDVSLGKFAEVKTFHAYCKKILHEQNGKVELVSYLTALISRDAELVEEGLSDFDSKLQNLEENSREVGFCLSRGDYYEVVSFNDSVYRVYRELLTNPDIVPSFGQILIDEFQDFNLLEVAFIRELEKKGSIIVVGDDDQAIYDDRHASPAYLRDKHKAGEYQVFELPFCIRCPEVIVEATNKLIQVAQSFGYFKGRIPKRFECYLPVKEADSVKYPKIVTVQCSTVQIVSNYIEKEIRKIDPGDVAESWTEGVEYPTVLIVGAKQYLAKIAKDLRHEFPQLVYRIPSQNIYGVIDGYEKLLRDKESNFAWRILIEFFLSLSEVKAVLRASLDGTPMVKLLEGEFMKRHLRVIEIIKILQQQGQLSDELRNELYSLIGEYSTEIIGHFGPQPEKVDVETDKTRPSILLTSFKGCKGLSAGHVFIVGANNGYIPRDPNQIEDLEISQFLVALTRTRKQCHIISNKWLYAPQNQGLRPYEKTFFLSWLPSDLFRDLGQLNAAKLKAL
jgi:superfamily I DNA/RNA helicase